MANLEYEDLFVEKAFASKIVESLNQSNCLDKSGIWKGISGNKLEIVAALDALDNLNLLKPGKQTDIAKSFCKKLGITVGKDIPMKSFYLTPPLKDYYRFRELFKEGLKTEIEKGEKEELERKRIQRLEQNYRNLVTLTTNTILNYQSLLINNLFNEGQIQATIRFVRSIHKDWDRNFPDIPMLYILPLKEKELIILKEIYLDEKIGAYHLAARYHSIDSGGRLGIAENVHWEKQEKFVPIQVRQFLSEFS